MTFAVIIFPLFISSNPPLINVLDTIKNEFASFQSDKPSSDPSGVYSSLLQNFGARLASIILVSPSEEVGIKWKTAAENFGLQHSLHIIPKSRAREIYYLSKFSNSKLGDLGAVAELSNNNETTSWKVNGEVVKIEGDDVIKVVSNFSKEMEPNLDGLNYVFPDIQDLKWKVVGVPDTLKFKNADDLIIIPINEEPELRGAQIMAHYLSGFREFLYFKKE